MLALYAEQNYAESLIYVLACSLMRKQLNFAVTKSDIYLPNFLSSSAIAYVRVRVVNRPNRLIPSANFRFRLPYIQIPEYLKHLAVSIYTLLAIEIRTYYRPPVPFESRHSNELLHSWNSSLQKPLRSLTLSLFPSQSKLWTIKCK